MDLGRATSHKRAGCSASSFSSSPRASSPITQPKTAAASSRHPGEGLPVSLAALAIRSRVPACTALRRERCDGADQYRSVSPAAASLSPRKQGCRQRPCRATAAAAVDGAASGDDGRQGGDAASPSSSSASPGYSLEQTTVGWGRGEGGFPTYPTGFLVAH